MISQGIFAMLLTSQWEIFFEFYVNSVLSQLAFEQLAPDVLK